MAVDDTIEALRRHFAATLARPTPRCSACDATKWEILGLSEMPIRAAVGQLGAPGAITTVVLACANCAHLIQFAWAPIQQRAKQEPDFPQLARVLTRGGGGQ